MKEMNILERLDTLEERYVKLIAHIDNTPNEAFKYSRKKTTNESKEIAELKEIIGITKTDKNTQVCFKTS